ncbi:class I SAM-dependent methyltransferase [Deinococcus aquiradiocola]|uniref:Methyltransferase n=1 Tax=Deinococcus aquiradiocola TaxID=393059 RepID=A0A917PP35_9DEIO|nr:class I SAM-dependent methyltransferase [Deinococcus aquiradiocola]GGJ86110.1 methyltransferase [Deinococcus aquiradiocola]
MHWSETFYARQTDVPGIGTAAIHPSHRALAARVTAHLGGPRHLLELGSGGGQFAVCAAREGHTVTAVERVPLLVQHSRSLARKHAVQVRVHRADFYTVRLPAASHDAVCYWDGFGIGTDDDQRRLLRRIAAWLTPAGRAYIDVYTPWYWAHAAGNAPHLPGFARSYGFDPDGCRMLDTYTPTDGTEPFTQSLRCYSPADLRLLLTGTPLHLTELWPGGHYDAQAGVWTPEVPLEQAMSYTAVLAPE